MKIYKTEVYTARRSYTSKTNLSPDEEKGIAANNYDNLPNEIDVEGTTVPITDEYDYFLPAIMSVDWEHRGSGWHVHRKTGLKVKKEQKATPDYYKENGNGDLFTTLTVKIPITVSKKKARSHGY